MWIKWNKFASTLKFKAYYVCTNLIEVIYFLIAKRKASKELDVYAKLRRLIMITMKGTGSVSCSKKGRSNNLKSVSNAIQIGITVGEQMNND